MSSQICTYDNLHCFGFIEPENSSFSNNIKCSHCTVNAHIITNLYLEVQRNNSSVADCILCYYTNAQSFMNKHDEFMNTVIDVINPHIIGITESWCHNDINESEIHIDGYTTYRKDRECAKSGDVLLQII